MRHIPIEELLSQIAKTEGGRKTLRRIRGAHTKIARKKLKQRNLFLKQNGLRKWSPLKLDLINILGNKCWYTEVELIGAPLTIDHFRPKCDYWFLALDPTNYRVACPYANSPNHNQLHGCAGGKGDEFPLANDNHRATGKNKIKREKPLLLDPCIKEDCQLIAFQETGRPIVNPKYKHDPWIVSRVEKSLILLNIDHPDFNSKREELYHSMRDDVKTFEELPPGSNSRNIVKERLAARIASTARFSIAAKQYLQLFRNHAWVQEILNAQSP